MATMPTPERENVPVLTQHSEGSSENGSFQLPRDPKPSPRALIAKIGILILAVAIAFIVDLGFWANWSLVALFLMLLLAHFNPKQSSAVLGKIGTSLGLATAWLHVNLKLTAVSALVTISGFLVLNYTNGLKQEIDLLRGSGDTERSQSAEAIRSRDEKIQNLLSATLNVPVLLSPQNNRSRVGNHVVLQWVSQVGYDHYLVEMTHFDGLGKSWTKAIPATNPIQASTLYPSSFTDKIEPGTYFWRVAAGDLENRRPSPQSSWSGYYRFDIFDSAIERIRRKHRLTIGVTYNQNSDFMRRNDDGEPYGFDAKLMGIIANKLGQDPEINIDASRWELPQIVEYPSIDALLRVGIMGGEVDYAVSSITKTRYRENLGIRFTQGYFDSHLVLLSRSGTGAQSLRDAKVGAIEKTTNADAAVELCRHQHCTPFLVKSFQDTVNALTDGTVRFILVDEPLSLQMIQQKQVKSELHDLARQLPDYQKLIGYPVEQYALATPDHIIQMKLTQILQGLEHDGTLEQMKREYKLTEPSQLFATHLSKSNDNRSSMW